MVEIEVQRLKEYRKRTQRQNPKPTPKTNAQRQKKYRENIKKKIEQCEELLLARKKHNSERAKKYREQLKLRKQNSYINSLWSSNDDSSTA